MGFFSEYIDKHNNSTFEEITKERKSQLSKIAKIRGRDVLVYASDPTKNAHTEIYPPDLLIFKDQLSFIKSDNIDILLETPGGIAETVEDMVNLIREKHDKVGIIIPGSAKSAGTIFAMAGDEILMGNSSSLGPIDAQIMANGKRFSADAFLDGLEKIKSEVLAYGLNPAYIPILQNISPGEIQHFENAQNFSRTLVRRWLQTYKFKYWSKHSSTGESVTEKEKETRADTIAANLSKHSDWLTHGRSIRIKDLENMRLQIYNYTHEPELCEAIERYYNLLILTFNKTGIYKIFETPNSQIYQSITQVIPSAPAMPVNKVPDHAIADIVCPQCQTKYKIQLNLKDNAALQDECEPYPKNNVFICKMCAAQIDISSLKMQFEAQTGMKVKI
ncbi:MAG: hypothetical protein VB074_03260 [Proteiniphilum sp.]|jgi:hypothetical protein|uniref:SDH family Clp fold serine proteinase n=1 Tax=Proteiniphilum sp. TaxID=1926877 RepID=UPI002B20F5DE|nr:hypothetical protein [Proteiniphilum sp.]MEA5127177.1 hypothetical protein [Proteiniphilum sp.]